MYSSNKPTSPLRVRLLALFSHAECLKPKNPNTITQSIKTYKLKILEACVTEIAEWNQWFRFLLVDRLFSPIFKIADILILGYQSKVVFFYRIYTSKYASKDAKDASFVEYSRFIRFLQLKRFVIFTFVWNFSKCYFSFVATSQVFWRLGQKEQNDCENGCWNKLKFRLSHAW